MSGGVECVPKTVAFLMLLEEGEYTDAQDVGGAPGTVLLTLVLRAI